MTHEILLEFTHLAQTIEKKITIHTPQTTLKNTSIPQPLVPLSLTPMTSSSNIPLPPSAIYGANGSMVPSNPSHPESVTTPSTSVGFNLFNVDKTQKRTPGRILKKIGDLYAMSGRFDLAITNFTNCIEVAKSLGDYIWQASAMESLISCQLASYLSRTDVIHVIVSWRISL